MTILAEGLHLAFFDKGGSSFVVLALDRFAPRAGEITVITGPSGSGKSTLLHVLAGLQRPSRGRVMFGTVDVYALGEGHRDRWRRHSIGLVFQDFHLIPELSILANVTLPATFERGGSGRNGVRYLERLHVPTTGRTVNALSRGEQQRVAIARALAYDPPVILADEPTASLDAAAGEQVRVILREFAEGGRTVVVASHDPAIVSSADRVLRLERGTAATDHLRAA